MFQTEIQNQAALRLGSWLLEIGDTLSSMQNIGVMRDISWAQQGETTEIAFDNGDGIKRATDGDKFRFIFTLCEINWSNIEMMNSGQVEVTSNAGTPVASANHIQPQTEWAYSVPFELTGQNANGNVPTINSVTGSVNGALVLNTDYVKVKLPNGRWAIAILDSVTVTTLAQDIDVDYDYTPAANKTVVFNGSAVKEEKYIRMTNTNDAGDTKVIRMSGVTNVIPMVFDFAGDEEADVATLPVELEGTVIDIVDAQQTT